MDGSTSHQLLTQMRDKQLFLAASRGHQSGNNGLIVFHVKRFLINLQRFVSLSFVLDFILCACSAKQLMLINTAQRQAKLLHK